MAKNAPLEDALNQIALLLEEMGIASGLWYQSLLPILTSLRSGRSPKALSLEEKLIPSQDYLGALRQILQEFESHLSGIKNTLEKEGALNVREPLELLEKERIFFRQFEEVSGALMKKLNLIAREERMSSLGRQPIDEAWGEIERMVNETNQRDKAESNVD